MIALPLALFGILLIIWSFVAMGILEVCAWCDLPIIADSAQNAWLLIPVGSSLIVQDLKQHGLLTLGVFTLLIVLLKFVIAL